LIRADYHDVGESYGVPQPQESDRTDCSGYVKLTTDSLWWWLACYERTV